MKSFPRFLLGLLSLTVACLLSAELPVAAPLPSITGDYESEGSVIQSESGHTGAVSLPGLLGLEFDLATGAALYAEIAKVEIEQRDRTFTVRTRNHDGKLMWTGTWERNGGYEPTPEGVKILLRHARFGEDFFMFTLSTIKDGTVLVLDAQRIQASKFGPIGKPVGKFLFLRKQP